jgi:predicted dehydrogenase
MRLGVIGYGFRISVLMKELIKKEPACQIVAITDINRELAMQRISEAGYAAPRYYENADDMLAVEQLDGVLIGTRCSLHTEMALKVLPRGIPLFMEKPVATTMEDWQRLKDGADRYPTPVVVSFPLRYTPLIALAKELLDAGKIGKVEHVQAINNVTYGGTYYHSWYRDERETGGLFLQKTTHDFDYIQYLVNELPVSVCAVKSKQVFKGNKPAGHRCCSCDERDCGERVVPVGSLAEAGDDYCCFAEDTGNEDSASAIVTYESGMHMSYSQNFFVRGKTEARGARLMGYKGTMDFDFYTGKLNVYMHHTPRTETYSIETNEGHFGGDSVLAQNFLDVAAGRDNSLASLDDGLLSALMCLNAKQSSETGTFRRISWT